MVETKIIAQVWLELLTTFSGLHFLDDGARFDQAIIIGA